MFGFCLSERRGRSAVPLLVWAVLVALLGSLLTLTTTVGAAPARAVESECAPLALAPFGDPGRPWPGARWRVGRRPVTR